MAKISQLEALRRGQTIEDKPGVYARLNPETKSIEYSTGEVSFVGNDPDYFPSSDLEKTRAQEKGKVEREIEDFPLGRDVGEFAYQFGQKGAISGGVLDWVERITNTGDDYLAKKVAKEEVSSRISGESPIKSGLATATSFVPDIVATHGMSATKAAPLLTGIGAGSRVIDEPGKVAGEAGLAAGAGFLLDKGGQFLSRTAKRRGLSRRLSQEAQEVEARNAARAAELESENLAAQQNFQKEKEWSQRESQARQHQFNLEKTARENEMMRARQAYDQAKASQSAESEVLRQEYQEAQRAYQEALKEVPGRQAEAQREISQRASKYYDSVAEQLPANSTINTGALGVEEFIDTGIRRSANANTAEGREAQKIISSIFGDTEQISGRELARRLKALDEVIERSSRGTQVILDEFKRSIGKNIGQEVALKAGYSKVLDIFNQGLTKDINSIVNDLKLDKSFPFSKSNLRMSIIDSLEESISSMSPEEFMSKLRLGDLSEELARKSIPKEKFFNLEINPGMRKILEKQGMLDSVVKSEQAAALEKQYQGVVSDLANFLDNKLSVAEMEGSQAASQARRLSSRRFREAYGVADPVKPPSAPVEPSYPQAPQPPQSLPQPIPPSPVGQPQPPQMASFTPESAPMLPQASGAAETLGDALERPVGSYFKGKGMFGDLGPIGNIGKLKYLLGSKTLPIAGLYQGARALTSPSAAGQMVRQGIDRGGMEFLVYEIASSYPSYSEGILIDPNDRKLAVSRIETNPSIGIEDKAQLQAYINRGKSLEKLIRRD